MRCSSLSVFCLSLAGLALVAARPALAQTSPADTTRLRYTEEVAAPPAPAAVAVPRAARQQWKLGLNNFLLNSYPFTPYGTGNYYDRIYYSRVGLHLAYERQVGRAFSVQAEVSPALTYSRSSPSDAIEGGFAMRAQVAGRYYHNLERRLRRGHRPSQFAANYVSLAWGTGLGGPVLETPNYLLTNHPGFTTDLALLYGLQRRLGRYGFLDAGLGLSGLLVDGGLHSIGLAGSLRVGLALPEASRAATSVPAGEVTTLLPRAYVGAQAGGYSYRVHYSEANPFPANTVTLHGNERWVTSYPEANSMPSGFGLDGYGTYTHYVTTLPYVYAGYYLTPRLALQVGAQREVYTRVAGGVSIDAPDGFFLVPNVRVRYRDWATPVQVRYALTPVLQQRFQVEVLGGITPHWSAVELHEYAIANRQATDQVTYEFQRSTFEVHGSAGLAVAYGVGRRRRVQAVAEGLLTKNLRYGFKNLEPLQGGASLGLRYRFVYR